MDNHRPPAAIPLELDLDRMRPGPEGLDGPDWPVCLAELQLVRDTLARRLSATARAAGSGVDAQALRTVALPLLGEALTAYFWHAVAQRGRRAGLEPSPHPGMSVLPALLQGGPLAEPALLALMRQAFAPRNAAYYAAKHWNRLKGLLRPSREEAAAPPPVADRERRVEFLEPPRPQRRAVTARLTPALAAQAVITTRRNDLIAIHAAALDETPRLVPHRAWFRPVKQDELAGRLGKVLPAGVRNAVLDALWQGIEAGGEGVPGQLRRHLTGTLDTGCALAAAHLERLHRRPERLPRRLWTGTCGNTWDRMLRLAVREHGGHVTGHSHAGGSEYKINPYTAANEFLACDRYLVYKPALVGPRMADCDPGLLFEDHVPEVAAPPDPVPDVPSREVRPSPVRTIMYVGTFIHAKESMNPSLSVPDRVAVDWEARLLARLTGWGYRVLLKPHPESFQETPPGIRGMAGVEVIGGRMEECLHLADVFLFDSQSSTTFSYAFKTTVPVVLVDLGRFPWAEGALEVFRRRGGYVRGRFDAQCRGVVDWDELERAIEEAPAKAGDTEFLNRFIG